MTIFTGTTNGRVSFWHADMGGPPQPRAPLSGDVTVDVAIVGGGYTGLWTALYLNRLDPALRIAVIEKRFCGYGASGRNGGWLSGGFEWSRDKYIAAGGTREGVIAMQAAMAGSVDEVIARAAEEDIDADILRCDKLMVATCAAQLERRDADLAELAAWDFPASRLTTLDGAGLASRLRVAGGVGGLAVSGSARVQPAKLVRGLARAVERRGVALYEGTTVTGLAPGMVTTDRGTVRAGAVIRATEGFTPSLPGLRREWLPLNSAIIATAPLSPAQWREIGWEGHEIVADYAHAYFYAQRTREGRIAFGGRGIPYRFGSALDRDGQTQAGTIRILHATLMRLFPSLAGIGIDHAWCGTLGVPRDWCTSVGFDPATRMGWAGGYVGLGVSTSNVAGRTLADLVLGRQSDLVTLPWVNHKVRPWEPEPLRWGAVNALYGLYRLSDRIEAKGGGTSILARIGDRIAGH
ncbi:hypothetical protein Y88_2710 [Novosphingobium nitrogenifigens DSM 19370]|uniref:FAD dependent oxidoreductase domain-containing protein n=2 Tax=Novosphingobium nitrogenifigens TaxID=378548 RepID=F1Z7B4_9SPHN|nr:FAD-binding oxidoreductase [Novosphingobium nitrogenifigens]EGD59532.1 hypothetical protein Y88_2710 [Novosphingobium nitrogenifigens DSM 19370]